MSKFLLQKFETKSVFIRGMKWITGTDEIRQYFESFGKTINIYIFMDNYRGMSLGHALVKFQDEAAVSSVLEQGSHIIDDQEVIVQANIGGRQPSQFKSSNRKDEFSSPETS